MASLHQTVDAIAIPFSERMLVTQHRRECRKSVRSRRRRPRVWRSFGTDAGRGFHSALTTSGIGLASMRRRVERLKGVYEVWTAAGRGTRITVQIPV